MALGIHFRLFYEEIVIHEHVDSAVDRRLARTEFVVEVLHRPFLDMSGNEDSPDALVGKHVEDRVRGPFLRHTKSPAGSSLPGAELVTPG